MRHLLFPFVTLLVFSVGLAACSGGGGGGGGGNASSADGETTIVSLPDLGVVDEVSGDTFPAFKKTGSLNSLANTDVTLQGLAVRRQDKTIYERDVANVAWDIADSTNLKMTREIGLSRIALTNIQPVVTLTFGENADIVGVTAYADAKYTDAIADRSIIFGFDSDSNYMAYISWETSQDASDLDDSMKTGTLNDIDGMMIAGIETQTLPSNGTATFNGKGGGVYGTKTESFNTIFGVTAAVNFGANMVDLSVNGTVCTDCGTFDASILNFTDLSISFADLSISFSDGNDLNQNITLDNTLTGTLDARFYGDAGDGANEFGGTFALVETDMRYYYGVFGGKRGDITVEPVGPVGSVDTAETFSLNALDEKDGDNSKIADTKLHASLADVSTAANGGDAIDITLQGLTVLFDDVADYMRDDDVTWLVAGERNPKGLTINHELTLSRFKASAVDISFGSDGVASVTKIYLGDEYTDATIDRSTIFGFDSDSAYMAYISWGSSQTISDLEADATTDMLTHIDGMMIAGVETNNLPTDNITTFTGKGGGVYGSVTANILTSYNTEFTVISDVNFVSDSVNVTTSGTACIGDNCSGVTVPSFLNFSALNLDFANGNNIKESITAGSLSGTLDARFYGNEGDGANEFGGTFALVNDTANNERYYYGAFGAKRGDIVEFKAGNKTTLNALDATAEAVNPPDTDIGTYKSFSEITAGNVTLDGLAVALDDTSHYARYTVATEWTETDNLNIGRQITPSRITSSVAKLTFADGAITGATAYADAEYTDLTADRSTIFGFDSDSDYMAYISWSTDKETGELGNTTTDSIYNRNGMMIAGFETADNNIFITGKVDFAGKGAGLYGTKDVSFDTNFTATAAVDFISDNVTLTVSNTACSNCNDFDTSTLDFADLTLSFASGNSMSQDLTIGTLTGKLDARFYGGAVQELGGTFALAEADTRHYYGAFGATRHNVVLFVGSNTTTLNALDTKAVTGAPNVNTPSASLTASATNADTGVVLKGLAVSLNDVTDYERYKTSDSWVDDATELKIDRKITPTHLTESAVTLSFEGNTAAVTTIHADAVYNVGDVDRSTVFDFASDYMAYISWSDNKEISELGDGLEDSIYRRNGMMIAGIETANGNILTAGTVSFMGKGTGVYGTKAGSFDTNFMATAAVDFTARNMKLTTVTEACTDCNNFDVSTLDFTNLSLSFANADNNASINNISKNVTLDNTLSGKLDARFYGGAAQEFGGTFALAEADTRYYYGAFGGQYASGQTSNFKKPVDDLTVDKDVWNEENSDSPFPDLSIPTDADNNIYTSIEALRNDTSLANNTKISFTLPVLGTHRHDRWKYQRNDVVTDWDNSDFIHTSEIVNNTGSVLSLNFHVIEKDGTNKVFYQGGADTESLVLYRKISNIAGDEVINRYAGNTSVDDRTYFDGKIVGLDENNVSNYMKQYRGDESNSALVNLVGFAPENLVVFYWYIAEDKSVLGAENLTADTNDIFSMALAGLETEKTFDNVAFGTIPTSDNVMFTGKGTAFYGYERAEYAGSQTSTRKQIVFNMAAKVDFGAHNVNFSIYNTCYVNSCTIKQKGLDFDANISFDNEGTAHNNMTTNVTTSNGLLTGTLDTRFYGDEAEEFGGSFAMTGNNDNIYYYGIFAGNQTFDGTDGFSLNEKWFEFEYSMSIVHSKFPTTTNIPYMSFAEAAGANEASQFVMRGVAIQKHDVTDYVRDEKTIAWDSEIDADVSKVQDISLLRSDAPAVKFDFDATGKISALEAYFGFNIYTAVFDANATDIIANGTIAIDDTNYADADNSSIVVDRKAFGFTSDYMVYLSWDFAKTNLDGDNVVIADDIYNINGMMVAGIDTQNMPTSNITNFLGAGKGNYGDKDTNHAVTFETFAEVDFASRKVALEISKTACVADACTLDADTLNTLDFTKSLTYNAGDNKIGANMSDDGLSGVIYTRFYGTGDDAAGEFGGTFALKNSTNYYYGAFGTYKGGTFYTVAANNIENITIASPKPVVIPIRGGGTAPYAWFRSAIIDKLNTDDKLFTLHGGAVYGGIHIDYNRTAGQDWRAVDEISNISVTRVVGASASINVNGARKISDITLHLDGKDYIVDAGGTPSGGEFKHTISDANGATGKIAVDRRSAIFGFTPYSMVYVNWELIKEGPADNVDTDSAYTQRGMMLVGNESAIGDIPLFNAPVLDNTTSLFTGKGRGFYNRASGEATLISRFNVTANIDFAGKTVSINTVNNYLCNLKFQYCRTNSALDFKTINPLSYADSDGNIISNGVSGYIASKDDSNNFEGTLDAKFYGTYGTSAREFGGTFAMIDDNNNHFYGMFATERKDTTFDYSADEYDTGGVARVRAPNPVVSPKTVTYPIHFSFLDAHQDSKSGSINQFYDVSTPALTAYREDTIRYVRSQTDTDDETWDNAETNSVTVVANIDNSSSHLKYNTKGASVGEINSVRIFGRNISYALSSGSNSSDDKVAADYHYFTGNAGVGNSLSYYEGSSTQVKNFDSNTTGNLTVMRPNEFGFRAKYMAYIRWNYDKDSTALGNDTYGTSSDVDGYMLTGFETEHNTYKNVASSQDDLPETGTATFVGGGMGAYHHAMGQGYRTRFDANAVVNFATGTVDFTLNGTKCEAGLGDCGNAAITDVLSSLDITNAALSFDKGVNKINNTDVTVSGMNGQIDAKFYGQDRESNDTNGKVAKEFGGAFSFRKDDKSYIGIFGACDIADAAACPQPED